MKPKAARPGSVIQSSRAMVAIACVALLSSGNGALLAQTPPATQPAAEQNATPAPEEPKIPNNELDSLVSPIALYPDPLWPRPWPHPRIRWRSFNFNSGWPRIRS